MNTNFFAKIISFVFHPFVILIFLPFVLVYKTTHDFFLAVHWTIYTGCFLVTLALFVFIAAKKKIFTDLDVSKREQRPLLFVMCLLTGVFYLISLMLFHAPPVLFIVTFGLLFGVLVASIINKRIKASMHVATLTGISLTVAIGYGGYFYLLLFLIPLLAWSRIKIKRHTKKEAITGGIVGSLLSLVVYSTYLAVKIISYK